MDTSKKKQRQNNWPTRQTWTTHGKPQTAQEQAEATRPNTWGVHSDTNENKIQKHVKRMQFPHLESTQMFKSHAVYRNAVKPLDSSALHHLHATTMPANATRSYVWCNSAPRANRKPGAKVQQHPNANAGELAHGSLVIDELAHLCPRLQLHMHGITFPFPNQPKVMQSTHAINRIFAKAHEPHSRTTTLF